MYNDIPELDEKIKTFLADDYNYETILFHLNTLKDKFKKYGREPKQPDETLIGILCSLYLFYDFTLEQAVGEFEEILEFTTKNGD